VEEIRRTKSDRQNMAKDYRIETRSNSGALYRMHQVKLQQYKSTIIIFADDRQTDRRTDKCTNKTDISTV